MRRSPVQKTENTPGKSPPTPPASHSAPIRYASPLLPPTPTLHPHPFKSRKPKFRTKTKQTGPQETEWTYPSRRRRSSEVLERTPYSRTPNSFPVAHVRVQTPICEHEHRFCRIAPRWAVGTSTGSVPPQPARDHRPPVISQKFVSILKPPLIPFSKPTDLQSFPFLHSPTGKTQHEYK